MEFSFPEIVISGVSARLPESDNILEFANNLFNEVDMITEDNRRWTPGLFGLPRRNGKLKYLDKFDAEFFGISEKQANVMDPMLRTLLECTFEAVFDAGINPSTLKGTKTGVYVGAAKSESSELLTSDPDEINEFNLFGHSRGMFANGISYHFGLIGPSLTIETACSSSLMALERAVLAIRSGQCENAIVAGANLLLKPQASLEFHKLNMLSQDGRCKSFDRSANGYVRSEAVVVIFVQKRDIALKSYATILNIKSNSDGYKTQGVTYPSGKMQQDLLKETYTEIKLDPTNVDYIEAHGTGTAIGDPEELNAIANYLCQNRTAKNPLLIGSVKSNMGHSEHASGLCSVVKILVAIVYGQIPGNLHFKEPNPNIPGLLDGTLKVVTKSYKWNQNHSGIFAINNFGFGGSNVHLVMKAHSSSCSLSKLQPSTPLPLLIPFSGRTQSSIVETLHALKNDPKSTVAAAPLFHTIHKHPIPMHCHRGFLIADPIGSVLQESIVIQEAHQLTRLPNIGSRQLWFVFSGMGSQWPGMGKALLEFRPFMKSIKECAEILQPYKIDLFKLLTSDDPKVLESTLNSFVSIAAMQIGMVDLLFSLGIKQPDGVIGHSIGETVCPYGTGSATKLETLLVAYWAGLLFHQESQSMEPGSMATIGLSWEEAEPKLPLSVHLACHNAPDNVTVAGPTSDIKKLVHDLSSQGIFAREIDTGMAFHSPYVATLQEKLELVLLNNNVYNAPHKERSCKWISTSYPSSEWDFPEAKYITPQYFAHNLAAPVLFKEALQYIPIDSTVIEIGPHCLLQPILKRCLDSSTTILGLSKKNAPDNLLFCLSSLGRLYTNGYDMDFSVLYDNCKDTMQIFPFLSHFFKWDHEKSYKVVNFEKDCKSSQQCQVKISLQSHQYLEDYKLNNCPAFPNVGCMILVWDMFSQQLLQHENTNMTSAKVPVTFENIHFISPITIPFPDSDDGEGPPSLTFTINILHGCGKFEVRHSEIVVVTGCIKSVQAGQRIFKDTKVKDVTVAASDLDPNDYHTSGISLIQQDIYLLLDVHGCSVGEQFQHLTDTHIKGTHERRATLLWNNNWTAYLENFVQFINICNFADGRPLACLSGIDYAYLDPDELTNVQGQLGAVYLTTQKRITAPGVELHGIWFAEHEINSEPNLFLTNDHVNTLGRIPEREPGTVILTDGFVEISSGNDDENEYNCAWTKFPIPEAEFPVSSDSGELTELCRVHYGYVDIRNGNLRSFSGTNTSGTPVMGLVFDKVISSEIRISRTQLWKVPSEWNLDEIASVPFIYALAYYSIVEECKLKPCESILIPFRQDPTFSQAVISIASHMNCQIYLVVNSDMEKAFVETTFPCMPPENVIVSWNMTKSGKFEYQILQLTNGNGVDVVINLEEETLQESSHCVAQHGRLLNVTKKSLDSANHSSALGMSFFLRNITLHNINHTHEARCLSTYWIKSSGKLFQHISDGIKSGTIQPIPNVRFPAECNQFQIRVGKSHLDLDLDQHQNQHVVLQVLRPKINETVMKTAKDPYFIADPRKSHIAILDTQIRPSVIENLKFFSVLVEKCHVKKLVIVVNNKREDLANSATGLGLISLYIMRWKSIVEDLEVSLEQVFCPKSHAELHSLV